MLNKAISDMCACVCMCVCVCVCACACVCVRGESGAAADLAGSSCPPSTETPDWSPFHANLYEEGIRVAPTRLTTRPWQNHRRGRTPDRAASLTGTCTYRRIYTHAQTTDLDSAAPAVSNDVGCGPTTQQLSYAVLTKPLNKQ